MGIFRFKQFSIQQDQSAMKVGMDGVLLGAWANAKTATSILDIGTGTALLALMLAQRNINAYIHAVEIDDLAYEEACINVAQSPWANRVTIAHKPIQDYALDAQQYSLIVSNPPFFGRNSTLAEGKQRQTARSTNTLTHTKLLAIAQKLLIPGQGVFCLILPIVEGEKVLEEAPKYNLYLHKLTKVIPREGKEANRLLIEFRNTKTAEPIVNELVCRNPGNTYHDYTQEYIELCKAFYLKM
ncbi:MAG: methyltransferase [Aureispira sp.]|nr:methyltransferase [Aureispira sp.]